MSTSHQYHQPNAPDSPTDDNDSDMDIDLQELDPQADQHLTSSSSPGHHTHTRSPSYNLSNFAKRIPLRNLRAGRQRQRIQQEDDDLEGLLEDGPESSKNNRESGGSDDSAHDGAPLLSSKYGQRRQRRKLPETALSKIGFALRLPSFASQSTSLPQHDTAVDDEPEDDHDPSTNRLILVGQKQPTRFPLNAISNAKYTPWSFVPRTLYNEFKFFLNLYFLLVALSQIIPALRIGYLSTYIAPLAFVLVITLGKEALDDVARRRRDAEANAEPYTVVQFQGEGKGMKGKRKKKVLANRTGSVSGRLEVQEIVKPSKDLKVGDVLKLGKNQRVPADVVILQSIATDRSGSVRPEELAEAQTSKEQLINTDGQEAAADMGQAQERTTEPASAGEAFIRTDQLDGETDWKLRLPSALSQRCNLAKLTKLKVTAAKPDRKVNEFIGMMELDEADSRGNDGSQRAALSIDNTAWANTVLASSTTVYAVVVYTGSQTRQALSTSASRSKIGLLELELNTLTKILCALTLTLSGLLVLIGRIEGQESRKWYISVFRFLILFSTVVPISLRVNLDMGKTVYAWFIEHDKGIPDTIVRTSTIPEDLGRIEYLLSDKTGTLTQNEMELKKVHVGTVSYANEAMDEVTSYVSQAMAPTEDGALVSPSTPFNITATSTTRTRREIGSRVRDLVMALAICHNVTPTTDEVDKQTVTSYQASSPDEIAIVRWTENVGLRLVHRDRIGMTLESLNTGKVAVRVRILNTFPFTSESKRMGIIVHFFSSISDRSSDDEIWFYQKGADTVMTSIVAANDWLDEETANMAREGLRTLVVGRKRLSSEQYEEFSRQYFQASLSLQGRDNAMADVVQSHLERNLELLGVTGVEDKLQQDVKPSLELLRNAGIKIWMLTGDKVETARCVAISSKLVARGQYIHTISKLKRKDLAYDQLNSLRGKPDACLLIDGESLHVMLTHLRNDFISIAVLLPAVVACRCSPTQKADIAKLIRGYTKKRVCCIGDGGNDVSMIQAADVGVGIVGKEGRQASLAADFSIQQFHYLTKLLVWHGRNSYKRSAKLAQFVIHRGLIISVCQTMFSIAGKFEPNALYRVRTLFFLVNRL
jgi:phospholipid-translocating ATPase